MMMMMMMIDDDNDDDDDDDDRQSRYRRTTTMTLELASWDWYHWSTRVVTRHDYRKRAMTTDRPTDRPAAYLVLILALGVEPILARVAQEPGEEDE